MGLAHHYWSIFTFVPLAPAVSAGLAPVGTPIALGTPPEVVRVGVGRHGVRGLVDRFSLPELWSLHLYSYSATLAVDGQELAIGPDDISLVPPRTQIEYRYLGPSQHLYAHLRVRPQGPWSRLPLVQPAGSRAATVTALMSAAVQAFPTSPERSQAFLWAVLCGLQPLTPDAGEQPHGPYVGAAMAYLEAHLAGPVTVPEVARQVGISHNHLTRLFRAELGCTVVGYLRQARLGLAQHLLTDSTMSIAAVATMVGIPDLQVFNKACRRFLGASPRAVRAAGVPAPS
jgi:AraC-like DNA-binding protein